MAKEVEIFKLDFQGLNRSGRYAKVVGVAVVVECDDGCSRFVWLVGSAVSPASDGEPS